MTEWKPVKVYESQGIFAAEVVKSKLEANGIPAMLRYESVGQVIGITVDGLGRVEVYVSSENAAKAAELLREEDEEKSLQEDDSTDNSEDSHLYL